MPGFPAPMPDIIYQLTNDMYVHQNYHSPIITDWERQIIETHQNKVHIHFTFKQADQLVILAARLLNYDQKPYRIAEANQVKQLLDKGIPISDIFNNDVPLRFKHLLGTEAQLTLGQTKTVTKYQYILPEELLLLAQQLNQDNPYSYSDIRQHINHIIQKYQ